MLQGVRVVPVRRPDRHRQHLGPLINARQRDRVARLHREGQGRRRAGRSSAAAPAPSSTRATTSSRRCSSTSTPTSTIAQEEIFGPVLAVHRYRGRRRRSPDRQQLPLRAVRRGERRLARPGARPSLRRIRTGTLVSQRRPVVRARLAVRRLQGERDRSRARRGRVRGISRNQNDRPPRPVNAALADPRHHRTPGAPSRRRPHLFATGRQKPPRLTAATDKLASPSGAA